MNEKLLKKLKDIIKPIYYAVLRAKLVARRKTYRFIRKFVLAKRETSYSFAILCIKKTAYADMAITNINSLHVLNPTHTFTLYCDTISANYLNIKKKKFDYPNQIIIRDAYGVAVKAWQYYKIEVHIEAAKKGQIDTDADGVWHHDPILDRSKITMLAYVRNFTEEPNEVATLTHLFPERKDYLTYRHCVAAFVSMPPQFMTPKVAEDMRKINDKIFTNSLDFLSDEKARGEARRLSEEFAVNLAIQGNYPQEELVVLKSEDGWGNKNILQSLYYGAGNKVNE
jgi:hypothetical protein